MPNFFIDRPIFAWVISILISIAGVLAILNLGIESYPNIAPPKVVVTARYNGASASTTEKNVTQVIEQELVGIDHLLYFQSESSSNGEASITLTFEVGTNPDIAQVQVQNKVTIATPRLPDQVAREGITVVKSNPDFLMFTALVSDNPSIDSDQLNDIVASRIVEQVGRISGVGNTRQLGSEYAMRVWIDPDKLRGYGLSPIEVRTAIEAQNVQFSAGSLGADPTEDSKLNFIVSAEKRLDSPEQFENIILRADPNGTTVKLKDVAQISFGRQIYGMDTAWSDKPAAGLGIQLLPGANALEVGEKVRAKFDELAEDFPDGVRWFAPYDTIPFIKGSIEGVVHTLAEAVVLVFFVMLIFLQNFRATIIPTLVIPVSLFGTFIGLKILGFSINQLSLFGMVLAIGIVVDDAIVVIENVERIMTEEGLSPRDASRKAMKQIGGAVVAITVVLMAVFVPSAFQPGASGIIYKQFALTMVIAMAFSAFLALSFTPALCASFLKPTHGDKDKKNFIFRGFDFIFDKFTQLYIRYTDSSIKHTSRGMVIFSIIVLLVGLLYPRLPASFVPEEDQGFALVIVQLPPGASIKRTQKVMSEIYNIVKNEEGFRGVFQITGYSFVGNGENVGMAFINLKDWSDRKVTARQFIDQTNMLLFGAIKDAQVFTVNLPTIRGLSQFGGIDLYLQARIGQPIEELLQAQNILLGKANQSPALFGVRPNTLDPSPQLQLKVDRIQAESMGLSVADIYNTIGLVLAPVYINDFNYAGRVKRVYVQAAEPFRMNPEEALQHVYMPSTQMDSDNVPEMIPLANVVGEEWEFLLPKLSRYNGYSAIEIVGEPATGHASGEAMDEIEKIINDDLPKGFGLEWTGQSYQEIIAGKAALLLIGLSIVIVFLALAALYESWSIPASVLLVVPLGLLGAVVFTMLRHMPNDLYFKIGMITVIGLAAKNAILIVEFAVEAQHAGRTLRDAVVESARLRLRPIVMTSIAFIGGVLPLVVSTGAGANARNAVGTGVMGGMLFATFFGVLLIPVFYTFVRRMLGDKLDEVSTKMSHIAPTGIEHKHVEIGENGR
ncbi:multidrug efflux RND transporter permease subunit [Candidatus Nitrosacidococcus tergens]|uniref:Efflux pump membrane transporter n=1 Tax=Candidatus Nitrosacidococcus tergens TaxID=553981 RepID=A0A7G1QAK0_9GAMM|nr:multidrug efflux RND transporter permease subunit [Candidatus Nitrosacidococcus tergens]CAB1276414.1 multidrug efflux system protein [Candidatus Nitrosacidococcus tergens]